MAEPLPMTDEQAGEAISRRRLPFTFAKRYGVVIEQIGEVDAMVAFKAGITPTTIVEIRRFLGMPIQFNEVNDAEFERRLSKAYENNSSEAMQMVEGLGDEMDLASLADSLPETEDLMEQEDDAPIIRLINALLTEAVKVNASDIHIETFEKRLVVRFRVDRKSVV